MSTVDSNVDTARRLGEECFNSLQHRANVSPVRTTVHEGRRVMAKKSKKSKKDKKGKKK